MVVRERGHFVEQVDRCCAKCDAAVKRDNNKDCYGISSKLSEQVVLLALSIVVRLLEEASDSHRMLH